jgi:predicted nucleic acid-binding protein
MRLQGFVTKLKRRNVFKVAVAPVIADSDFADATLVHLARRESLNTIFTVDHADFETYRIVGRRRFHIVPER